MNISEKDKLKKVYISTDQRAALLAFIEKETELRSGKFTNSFTYKTAQKLWETITAELNSMPGAKKDWLQWRKTWQDIKNKTKWKQATILRHAQTTGGGAPTKETINYEDDRVLQLIHPIVIEGDTRVPESTVEFDGLFSHNEEIVSIDHDYQKYNNNVNTEDINKVNAKPQLQEHPILERKKKIRHQTKAARLTHTITATAKLAEQNAVNITLKKEKIQLMQAEVQAKQRIAVALERIALAAEKILSEK